VLLSHPYFKHPVDSEAHADGKHGETLALLGQQGKGFSVFLFLKIIFLFFVRQCASGTSGTVTFECTASRSTFQLTLL
jgi:ABC-type microcin C transport system duplicated ATPase subunit YejF